MVQNAKISVSGFYWFCKKKIIMDGDGKNPLRIIIITDFYKLHENKGKA